MKQYEVAAIPEYLTVRSVVAALTREFGIAPRNPDYTGEAHDFPELFYVRDGRYDMFVGGRVYHLERGQMIIYAPMNLHYGVSEEVATASVLSFKADFGSLPSIYNRVLSLSSDQRDAIEQITDEAESCYVMRAPGSEVGGMLVREGVSEYRLQKLKRDLELFLIELYRREGLLSEKPKSGKRAARHEQFLEVVEFLRRNLSEELTVEDIARGTSMSVSKLKLLFRECAGSGPINYFIDMKLEKAKELILMGYYNFTEVAEALGFSSLHYFSRVFHARVGQSPTDWTRAAEAKQGE